MTSKGMAQNTSGFWISSPMPFLGQR
jgi:hypothetical protein